MEPTVPREGVTPPFDRSEHTSRERTRGDERLGGTQDGESMQASMYIGREEKGEEGKGRRGFFRAKKLHEEQIRWVGLG